MRYTMLASALFVMAGLAHGQPTPPAVGALPPTPFDKPFIKADSAQALQDALLNDPVFKKAVEEAVKAKKEVETRDRKIMGPTPAQAARTRFLQVLNEGAEFKPVGTPAK